MEWGTDHFDFMLEGVPTFVADQDEANYLENYHAISDTYDKVDFPQLKKHVAEAAALSVELADLPEKIGPRLTHDQIEQTIRETQQRGDVQGLRHLGRLGQRPAGAAEITRWSLVIGHWSSAMWHSRFRRWFAND